MAVQPTAKMTAAEFLEAFPEGDGVRRELIDGEVFVAPAPGMRHQELVTRLTQALAVYLEEHAGGKVLVGPIDVILADDLVPEPDLIFLRPEELDPSNKKNVVGPPSLVVEVVSDERRDLRIKRDRYERHGVPEYWAVLPEADQVQVFRLREGSYGRPELFEPGDFLSPVGLPGLRLDLTWLFRD
jgi:Uma2 family endonuclease